MDQKDKALKIALTSLGVLAVVMFIYYYVAWRTRTTEHDVNFHEKGDTTAESKSEFTGIYALAEPVEGLNRRLGFFTVNKKDDGSGGYFGSAKLDTIASTADDTTYLQCPDVNIAEKKVALLMKIKNEMDNNVCYYRFNNRSLGTMD